MESTSGYSGLYDWCYSSTEVSPRQESQRPEQKQNNDSVANADERELNESVRRLEELTARLALNHQSDIESALQRSAAACSQVQRLLDNSNNSAPVQAAVEHQFSLFIAEATLGKLESYDNVLAFFKKNHLLLSVTSETTQNTALHQVVSTLCQQPHLFDPFSVLLVVLMELGADRQAINKDEQMPIEIALHYENEMLVQLLTLEFPNKQALLAIAKQYGHDELARWLGQETYGGNSNNLPAPVKSVEEEGRQLAEEIAADPVGVYERVFAFYGMHPELLTRVKVLTGNTQLHQAVSIFVKGELPGIFEVLVLLEKGADRTAKNKEGKTALELAEAHGSAILVELLKQENPSKESLTMLAIEHGLETLATWLTQ